jgi:hypothetical protein
MGLFIKTLKHFLDFIMQNLSNIIWVSVRFVVRVTGAGHRIARCMKYKQQLNQSYSGSKSPKVCVKRSLSSIV